MVHNRDHPCFFTEILIKHTPKDYLTSVPQPLKNLRSKFGMTMGPLESCKCKGMDKTFFFLILKFAWTICHFHLLLLLLIIIIFSLGYSTLWGEKIHSLPYYLLHHVCDSFSYANVNVNMYFEAVLLLLGSLSHSCADLVSARQTKVLIGVG